jgi:hypothetical protein
MDLQSGLIDITTEADNAWGYSHIDCKYRTSSIDRIAFQRSATSLNVARRPVND